MQPKTSSSCLYCCGVMLVPLYAPLAGGIAHDACADQGDHGRAGVRLAGRRVCARSGGAAGLAAAGFGTGERRGAAWPALIPELAAKFDERLDPWYYRYGKMFWHDPVYQMTGLSRGAGLRFRAHADADSRRDSGQRPRRATACWWAAERPARWPASRDAFNFCVRDVQAPRRIGSRRHFPSRRSTPSRHLAAFDKRRAAVIRKFYQQEWCSRGLYHMLLNSCMGTEAMIAAVQCAAGLVRGA